MEAILKWFFDNMTFKLLAQLLIMKAITSGDFDGPLDFQLDSGTPNAISFLKISCVLAENI